jgi:hypothetical protein
MKILNPDKILYGKDLFYENLNSKTYNIYKIDDKIKEKFMVKILIWFARHSKKFKEHKHYIGIDYEFNKISKGDRTVALMQMNLENELNIGHVFLLNPETLEPKYLEILKRVMSIRRVIKILHGSESLDIPYLYNQLLISKKYVTNFSKNFFDTKLICDYIKLESGQNISCSIYDLLDSSNIISKATLKLLEENEENMPPLWTIVIDINKLSEELYFYSICDVLFLPELIKNLRNRYNTRILYLSEMFNLINIDKRNIDNVFKTLIEKLNKYNNSYIFINNKIYTFVKLWKVIFPLISFNKFINIAKQINFLKNLFVTLAKFILYKQLADKYKAFISKNTPLIFLNTDYYYNWFKTYPLVYKLLLNIQKLVTENIHIWINSIN